MARLPMSNKWQDLGHVRLPLGGCQEEILAIDEVDEVSPSMISVAARQKVKNKVAIRNEGIEGISKRPIS